MKNKCEWKMRKSKGFTLIEIIAVVVIIAILAALIIPAISKYVKSGKDRYNKELENQLMLVGKDYYASNPRELPENNKIKQVWLPFLKSNNYTSEEFKDADGGKCTTSYVRVKKASDNYEYIPCLVCENYKTVNETYCVLDDSFIDNEGENKCPGIGNPTCEISFPNYDGGWATDDVSFTVKATAYTSSDSPECLHNEVVNAMMGNGVISLNNGMGTSKTSVTGKKVSVSVQDLLGNVGSCESNQVVKIDKTAPVCQWEGPYSNKSGSAYGGYPSRGSLVYYRLNCTDAESGIAVKPTVGDIQRNSTSVFTSLRLVDTKSLSNGESYLFETVAGDDGYGRLTLPAGIVKDQAGRSNIVAISERIYVSNYSGGGGIVIPPSDTTPPVCTITMKKADGTAYYKGDWSNQNVTVTANCSDSSGIADISYSPSQTITKDGVTNVTVIATDNEGNSGYYSTSVQIDKTKPSCTLTMIKSDGSAYTSGSWTNKNVKVAISCSDTGGSGLDDYYFTSTESTNKFKSNHTVDIEGIATISIYANDKAGNKYTGSKTVKLDKTPPEFGASICYDGKNSKNYMVFRYPWTDSGSGLRTIKSKHCYSTGVSSSYDYSCSYTGGIDGRSWDSRAGQFTVGNRIDSVYMEYKALPSSSSPKLHVSTKWYVCDVAGNCKNYGAPYVDHLNYSNGKYTSGNRSNCDGKVELDTYTRRVCQRTKSGGDTTYKWVVIKSGTVSKKSSETTADACFNAGYSATYNPCRNDKPCNSSEVGNTCRSSSKISSTKASCSKSRCQASTSNSTYSDWTCVDSPGQKVCTESTKDLEKVECIKE